MNIQWWVVMPNGAMKWMPSQLAASGLVSCYRKMHLDPECMMQTVMIETDDEELIPF